VEKLSPLSAGTASIKKGKENSPDCDGCKEQPIIKNARLLRVIEWSKGSHNCQENAQK
jgi:hypothetical protein